MSGRTSRLLAAALAAALLAGPGSAALTYDDVIGDVGITFRLAGEVSPGLVVDPWPGFPEILGSGACWGDFDGDGYDDLYLVNQRFNVENPHTDGWRDDLDPTDKLYINDGDGTFADRSAEAGIADDNGFGFGCSAADYDGDGDIDVFVSNFGDGRYDANYLYRNNGDGSFTDVAAEVGVQMRDSCGEFPCDTSGSSWADYDLDGDLDLFVLNYVETTLHDTLRSPTLHNGQFHWLFRNDGGTFTEVAEAAGVQGHNTDADGSKSFAGVWFDADLDGDLEVYVTNDGTPNEFYLNNGDGTFTDRSAESGLDDPRAGMGLTVGDYDNDGYPDLFFTHYVAEDDGFYHNRGDGTFEDRSGEDDLHNSADSVSWGTHFVDFDRDMDLDIMLVNGHTGDSEGNYEMAPEAYRQDPSLPGDDPWNRVWVDVSGDLGAGFMEERVSRGAAFADYDLDGDTDIVKVNNRNDTAQFLRATRDDGNHWLTLKLLQPGKNPQAIGARVTLEAGGVNQYREVQAGSSFLSQNTLNLEFGLGTNLQADTITVQWPGGGSTTVHDVAAGQVVRVERTTGAVVTDTIAPVTLLEVDGTPGAAGWWRSPVTFSLVASDRGTSSVSGVASSEYRLDGSPWTPFGLPVAIAAEGEHEVRGRSTDNAGNREPAHRVTVGLDFAPPSVSFELEGEQGDNGWYIGEQVTVRVEASDAVSGVDVIRYRVDDGPWSVYDDSIAVSEEGVHTVTFTALDVAGNEAPAQSVAVRLDRSSPQVAFLKPIEGTIYMDDDAVASPGVGPAVIVATPGVGPLVGQRFLVKASAEDSMSGMGRVTFLLNHFVVKVDYSPPYEWVWQTSWFPPGTYLLEAVAADQAGNAAAAHVQVLLVSTPALPVV